MESAVGNRTRKRMATPSTNFIHRDRDWTLVSDSCGVVAGKRSAPGYDPMVDDAGPCKESIAGTH